MEVIKVKNYEELSKVAADIIAELLKEKPVAKPKVASGFSFKSSAIMSAATLLNSS